MRNYVIINGVNSLTIQGLAINNLPPITKPMIRTQREEIDGRDGDIVTELGYSAYDKTMEIGLWGTYDIDAIIKYFTGEGTIVFSTEPDKYYYFKILNQIDYEKLLKFKKATVTLHCQPYKYPVSETPLEEQYEYVEDTGTDITLDNTEETIFNKFDLIGNTYQDSTSGKNLIYNANHTQDETYTNGPSPNPDYPQDIHVVSGDNEIKVEGKNLFDDSAFSTNPNVSVDSNGFYTGTLSNIYAYFNSNFKNYAYKENTQYTITYTSYGSNTNSNGRFVVSYADGTTQNWNITANASAINIIYRSTSGKTISKIEMTYSVGGTMYIKNIMLVEGNYDLQTMPPYQPYQSQTYPISLGDIELCKIGDYQDYIYKDNDKWYKYGAIGKVVLNGSENWSGNASSGFYTEFDTLLRTNNYSQKMLCNKFIIATNHTSQAFISNTITGYGESGYAGQNWVYLKVEGITSASDLKTWLSSNNTTVYYVLANPTQTEITDETLKAQLDDLWENAISYKGQTNITQTNNDLPFIMDVSALKDGSDHLIIDNIGTAYSKPTIDIEGTGIVDIYLNDEQIFEIDMTTQNEIIIDTEKMEAYTPDNLLANRLVTGDYSNFKLAPGENDLRFSGDLTKATVTRYIRWI